MLFLNNFCSFSLPFLNEETISTYLILNRRSVTIKKIEPKIENKSWTIFKFICHFWAWENKLGLHPNPSHVIRFMNQFFVRGNIRNNSHSGYQDNGKLVVVIMIIIKVRVILFSSCVEHVHITCFRRTREFLRTFKLTEWLEGWVTWLPGTGGTSQSGNGVSILTRWTTIVSLKVVGGDPVIPSVPRKTSCQSNSSERLIYSNIKQVTRVFVVAWFCFKPLW